MLILLGGKHIGYIAAAIGVITLISMANSGVLASSRFPFAMAIDKLLPDFMSKVHSKYLTPVVTIIMTCVVMALVILFLDVVKIAKLASAFKVMMFIMVNMSVIILRETSAQWYKPKYRSPLYPFIQIFGIISGLILLVFFRILAVVSNCSYISPRVDNLFLNMERMLQETGVLRRYGHRPALYLFL